MIKVIDQNNRVVIEYDLSLATRINKSVVVIDRRSFLE
jgi:DNA-binding transcriptional regulator/RsmH inhibitor MraZ